MFDQSEYPALSLLPLGVDLFVLHSILKETKWKSVYLIHCDLRNCKFSLHYIIFKLLLDQCNPKAVS